MILTLKYEISVTFVQHIPGILARGRGICVWYSCHEEERESYQGTHVKATYTERKMVTGPAID